MQRSDCHLQSSTVNENDEKVLLPATSSDRPSAAHGP